MGDQWLLDFRATDIDYIGETRVSILYRYFIREKEHTLGKGAWSTEIFANVQLWLPLRTIQFLSLLRTV